MRSKGNKRRPWWGDGLAPHVEWPGVTIELPAIWSRKYRRWASPDDRYYFDLEAAERVADFFPTFLHHGGGAAAGQPFTLLPYQAKLLSLPLFGWKRASDGTRRFRKVLLWAPKGAGKSPWGSGTALYLTLFDGEPGADVYALARDRDQARVVFNDARAFVETSGDLAARCEVLKDSIYVPSTRSTFRVVAADAGGRHGWRPHGVVLDELQEQRSRDLLEVAVKSMPKRRQPVLILMGHAGVDEESIGHEEYAYGKGVIGRTIQDDSLLPVIFEAQPDEDWQAEDTWRRVNPGYGITVQPDGIRAQAIEAANEPRKAHDFRRYMLNMWTSQAATWLPIEWWRESQVDTLDAAAYATYDVAAGLDMAQTIDYAAFTVAVRVPLQPHERAVVAEVIDDSGTTTDRPLDYALAVFPYYWLPEERLREREQEDGLPLGLYHEQGRLFTSPGATISSDQVFRDITTKIAPRFPKLRMIGFDPAFAADLAQRLSATFELREIPQTPAYMTSPCYTLEGLLKARRVRHDGHPILRWNAANVAIKRDEAGRLRPTKPKTPGGYRKRIDGIVGLLMAIGMLQRMEPAREPEYQVLFFGGQR